VGWSVTGSMVVAHAGHNATKVANVTTL
jgi:hypothetical protein